MPSAQAQGGRGTLVAWRGGQGPAEEPVNPAPSLAAQAQLGARMDGGWGTRAAGRQPGRALPGETSRRDWRTWPCVWRGVLCRGAFNRCAGQVLGTQRCQGALPSAGPAAQGVAVPGGRLGASWPLWASGRVGCSQDICLLASSLGGLTCPGLVSTLLSPILALGVSGT